MAHARGRGVDIVNALIATGLGLAVGLGVLLIIQGFRGRKVLPSLAEIAPEVAPEVVIAWFCGGLMAGIIVYAVTGWLVAALTVAGLVAFGYRAFGGEKTRAEMIDRTEAIAAWSELIRDNIAGAAGLEQALVASAAYAPSAINDEIKRFANRLDRMPLVSALQRLGADLDHPSADLVVVSLTNAARMEARELGPLLTRLAESIRADVRMRLRVEVGRARIRTSARIVTATTLFTILFVYVFSDDLLEVYSTLEGQLWMTFVIALFAAGGWMLHKYGEIELPDRFSARSVHRVPERTP